MRKNFFAGVAAVAMAATVGSVAQAKSVSEESRDVASFDEIYLKGSIDIEVKVGGDQSVRVEADSDIIDHVETDVRGGKLYVSLERGHYRSIDKMVVYVTIPSLKGAGVYGSGDLSVEDAEADDFEIEVHGSGDAVFTNFQVKDLEIELQGSGDIELDGSCDSIEVELQGSGDVDAEDLRCKSADVSIHGSGDVHVYATEESSASIHGSGDVVVSGEPSKVRSRVHGSGEIEIR